MKVVIQRVQKATCKVFLNNEYQHVSTIGQGYMILVGFTHSDSQETVLKMAKKIVDLRVFNDEFGKMNLNIKQVNGSILSISQFTLYGDSRKGNRPSFVDSMRPEFALPLYEFFNKTLNDLGVETKPGAFGENMLLEPYCDGPVTIEMEY